MNRRVPGTGDEESAGSADEGLSTTLPIGTHSDGLELRASLDPTERDRVEETVSRLLDLLGKAHTMAILRTFAFADGPLRFTEVEGELEIPANTLSVRLEELVENGLLVRHAYDEVPPRVEYEPTDEARALFPVFGHLHVWAARYELDGE